VKLDYCDRTMRDLVDREPAVTDADPDEDVAAIDASLEEFYLGAAGEEETPPSLDGALRTLFEHAETGLPASDLIQSLETTLMAEVYQWTGHFPERTRRLTRHLADRADQLGQVYRAGEESRLAVGLTALITALAANYVHRGTYLL
jgi:hypothetical protein